jgi:hypothetical protein
MDFRDSTVLMSFIKSISNKGPALPIPLNPAQSTQSCKQNVIDVSPRKQPNRNISSDYMRCADCGSKDHRDCNCQHQHCKFCLVVDHEKANCPKMEKAIQIESDTSSEGSEQQQRLQDNSSSIGIERDRYG